MTEIALRALIEVLREARAQLARPGNDYSWASWEGPDDALREVDSLIARLEQGTLPSRLDLDVLFAPTGPIQEVCLSSGWGQEFIELAARFDVAMKRVYARVRTVSATLKLEFIAEGSRDCPLLLLYGRAPEVVSALVRCLASDFKTLEIESFPGVEAVGGCRVAARMADRDLGVRQTEPTSFLWELSRSGWDQVAGLMEPFAAPSTPGDSQLYFQWLDKLRDVSLIISTGRRW